MAILGNPPSLNQGATSTPFPSWTSPVDKYFPPGLHQRPSRDSSSLSALPVIRRHLLWGHQAAGVRLAAPCSSSSFQSPMSRSFFLLPIVNCCCPREGVGGWASSGPGFRGPAARAARADRPAQGSPTKPPGFCAFMRTPGGDWLGTRVCVRRKPWSRAQPRARQWARWPRRAGALD